MIKLSIAKILKAFKEYARNYDVEIIDSRDQSIQLTISRPSIKDLFKDLLAWIKGSKYQITLKVLLRKYKENAERKFTGLF